MGKEMVSESKQPVNLFDSHKQLRDIVDANHPLVRLADSIDWARIEEELKRRTLLPPDTPTNRFVSWWGCIICVTCSI